MRSRHGKQKPICSCGIGEVGTITEFHEDTWYALLDYVTVYDKEDIRFTFKEGMEIQV